METFYVDVCGIPFEVKIIKNFAAFIIDSITMIIGLYIGKRVINI